jgi:hypothetical protein
MQDMLRRTLAQFRGRKMTPDLADQIQKAIMSSGLIDGVSGIKTDIVGKKYFTVEIDHGSAYHKTLFNVTLG